MKNSSCLRKLSSESSPCIISYIYEKLPHSSLCTKQCCVVIRGWTDTQQQNKSFEGSHGVEARVHLLGTVKWSICITLFASFRSSVRHVCLGWALLQQSHVFWQAALFLPVLLHLINMCPMCLEEIGSVRLVCPLHSSFASTSIRLGAPYAALFFIHSTVQYMQYKTREKQATLRPHAYSLEAASLQCGL